MDSIIASAVTAAAVVLVTLILMKRREKATLKPELAEVKANVIEAAKSGDIKLVKDHVMADKGCVLQADSEYDCLFLALALHQQLPMQFGSIFLISVIRGETALMKSSMEGHFDVTRFLVESKANLEAVDPEYSTPTA
jgi:hypothetical protein